MKRSLLAVSVILITAISCSAQNVYLFAYFKGNGEDGLHLAYSEDAYQWKALRNDQSFLTPVVSKDKLMRDPCIIKGGDGLFHMVWTVSWNAKGIGHASSGDLLHWSEQEYLPVMTHEEGARNCWAPEIIYDDKTGTYLIYWATTITGKFTETASEKENAYNHRMYYTTTKDFKNYAPTALLYDPGFNVIDATIIKDGKKYMMVVKDETREPAQKNLRIAYSDQLTGPYSNAGKPITGKYWAEGPTVLSRGNKKIIYFDKYTEHKYGAVQSADGENWEDVSDKISMPAGIRHGTVFTVSRKQLAALLKEDK